VPRYSQEIKDEAMTRALAGEPYSSVAEDVGTSKSTIARWVKQHQQQVTERNGTERNAAKKREEAAGQAATRAMAKFEQMQAQLADDLMETATRAREKIREALEHGPGDKEWAQWLRATVGALDYCIKNAQLLAGEATDRSEARHEHSYKDDLKGRVDRLAAGVRAGAVPGESDRE